MKSKKGEERILSPRGGKKDESPPLLPPLGQTKDESPSLVFLASAPPPPFSLPRGFYFPLFPLLPFGLGTGGEGGGFLLMPPSLPFSIPTASGHPPSISSPDLSFFRLVPIREREKGKGGDGMMEGGGGDRDGNDDDDESGGGGAERIVFVC